MATKKYNTEAKQGISTALFIPRNDVAYFLEPVAEALLKRTCPEQKFCLRSGLRQSVPCVSQRMTGGRKYRLEGFEEIGRERRRTNSDNTEVVDLDAVPPVSKRRGLPAAMAARLFPVQ